MENTKHIKLFDATILAFENAQPEMLPKVTGVDAFLDAMAELEIEAFCEIIKTAHPEAFQSTIKALQSGFTPRATDNSTTIQSLSAKKVRLENRRQKIENRILQRAMSAPVKRKENDVRQLVRLGLLQSAQWLADTLADTNKRKAAVRKAILHSNGNFVEAWGMSGKNGKTAARTCLPAPLVIPDARQATYKEIYTYVSELTTQDSFDDIVTFAQGIPARVAKSPKLAVLVCRAIQATCTLTPVQESKLWAASELLPAKLRSQFNWHRGISNTSYQCANIELARSEGSGSLEIAIQTRQLVSWLVIPTDMTAERTAYIDALVVFINSLGGGLQETPILSLKEQATIKDASRISPSNIRRAASAATKDFFSQSKAAGVSVLILSTHTKVKGYSSFLPHIVGEVYDYSTLAIAASYDDSDASVRKLLDPEADECWKVIKDTYPKATILGRRSTSHHEQNQEFLSHLREGGMVVAWHDHRNSPGQKKAAVPWFYRSHFLAIYPAYLAILNGSRVAFCQNWIDENGDYVIDVEPVRVPIGQGCEVTRAIWTTQRYGRAVRRFQKRNAFAVHPRLIANYGGFPTDKPLVPLHELDQATDQRESLHNWIYSGAKDASKTALCTPERDVTYATLRNSVLRMAQMLLHFQSEKPEHFSQNRKFSDQFRVMVILPRGEVIANLALASMATASLICICEGDLPERTLIARITRFAPDLIVAGASVWSRICANDASMNRYPTLICDNRGGADALEELIDTFDPATHLMPFRGSQPGGVFFTSGSSGEAKGVVIPLGALSENTGFDKLSGMRASDRVVYLARWDTISLLEILCCFRSGATAVLPPNGLERNPSEFATWVDQMRVSYISCTTSFFGNLAKSAAWREATPAHLVKGMLWGERTSKPIVADIFKTNPKIELLATYGTTETIYMSIGSVTNASMEQTKASPGGELVPQIPVELRGEKGEVLTNPDAIGCFHVKNADVMIGYLGTLLDENPVLADDTHYAFTHSDLVRVRNNKVEVLGRNDSVVKISGRRVSLIEIEVAGEKVAGVNSCVAFGLETDTTLKIMLAVEVGANAPDDLQGKIGAQIVKDIFATARPAEIVLIEKFPVLPSGKIDRVHLRALFQTPDAPLATPQETPPKYTTFETVALAKLFAWGNSRGLITSQIDFPNCAPPDFSSIEMMELTLLIEEVTGQNMVNLKIQNRYHNWAEVEACFHI